MTEFTEKWIMRSAIKFFGEEAQEDKTIEEMAELTQALLKHRLKPESDELRLNVLEEAEDARIMVEQMILMHGPIPRVDFACSATDRQRVDICIRYLAELENAIIRKRMGLSTCLIVAISNAAVGIELITKIYGRELLIREEKLSRLTRRMLEMQAVEEDR